MRISKIRIERTREKVVVYVHSGRVGMIIGKKGAEVDKLTKELEDLTHRHIEVKTVEVNRPEVDPQLVAESIGEQLAKRSSFRPNVIATPLTTAATCSVRASRSTWIVRYPTVRSKPATS